MYLGHAILAGPGFSRSEQKTGDVNVIDRVKPSETRSFLVIQFIVTRIYHSAYAPHDFLSVECQPQLVLAIIQRRIFRQTEHLIRMKSRNILLTILVQFVRKLDELLQHSSPDDFNYCIIRHFSGFKYSLQI